MQVGAAAPRAPAVDAEAFWADFHRLGRLLRTHRYHVATTMPSQPHSYTLRLRDWSDDDAAFCWAVEQIRARGYTARYGQKFFTYLDVNEEQYWTMGEAINTPDGRPHTILINRATIPVARAPYNTIAEQYDLLFHDEDSLAENDAVFRAVGDLHGQDVLDIGCGNGLACGYVDLDRYVGIDPAPAMLRQLHRHYPSAPTVCSTLKAFVTDTEAPPQYDVVLGLFGVGSYLSNLELSRIPTLVRPGGRAHVMFYAPGYVPVTHQRTNHYPPYRVWAPDRLEGMTQTIGHFILVTYRAEEPLGASR